MSIQANQTFHASLQMRTFTPNVEEVQALRATEQELHVLRRQLFHRRLVFVDGAVDHVGLFLLQHDHARLNRVFDAKACDDTRTLLPDAVATISGLPLSGRVPPSVRNVSALYMKWAGGNNTHGSTMKTLEASVKFSATPPAFRETRKTSTSVFFIKYSILL